MTRWWYGYTLSKWREHCAKMTDTALDETRVAIELAVEACDRQGVRGADAAFANAKKLRIVEQEIARRAESRKAPEAAAPWRPAPAVPPLRRHPGNPVRRRSW